MTRPSSSPAQRRHRPRHRPRCSPGAAPRRPDRPGRRRPGRRRREVEAAAAARIVLPHRRRRPDTVEAAADAVERSSARSTSGSTTPSRPCSRRSRRSTAEEYRRVTEVTYLGFVYGTLGRAAADAAARPRRDRPGRLRARLPRHPAAVGLLRRQARHPGLHRVAAQRIAARRQPGARHDGPDAGRQHPAVSLGAIPAAAHSAARAADLPARGRRPRPCVLRGRPSTPQAVLGRRPAPSRRSGPTGRPRPARPLPGPTGYASQQTDEPATRTGRTTCGSRSTGARAATTAPTAPSTTAPSHAPSRRSGPPPRPHRCCTGRHRTRNRSRITHYPREHPPRACPARDENRPVRPALFDRRCWTAGP